MIDNNGVARLAPAHQHSILAVPDTLTAGHSRLWGGVNNAYYPAPEFHVTKGRGVDWTVLITPESDVYGIGMVIYEVSSHHPVLTDMSVKSHVDLLGLDGEETVLWLWRYRCHVKGTGWGNSSTSPRQHPRSNLDVTRGMLEQGSF